MDQIAVETLYSAAVDLCHIGNFQQSFELARDALGRLAETASHVPTWKIANVAATAAYLYSNQPNVPKSVRVEGRKFARLALQNHPCDACRRNLLYYADRATDAFRSVDLKAIDFTPPTPYVPLNPSVWINGERRRCIVRNVNYRREKGKSWYALEDEVRTRNYVLEFDAAWNVVNATEMVDLAARPRTNIPIRGYEDCRAFHVGSQDFCTATVCDTNAAGIQEIALLTLDQNYAVVEAEILRGPWSFARQKNWMPLVAECNVRFIHSICNGRAQIISRDLPPPLTIDWQRAGSFRGGSQALAIPGGWLLIGHGTADENGDRIYLHRFLQLSKDFEVVAASEAFYFKQRGIEFCAGLARDGDRLIASFGVDDREAWLAFFSIDEVLASLSRDAICEIT
ncbi:MAG: hypothetical protein Q6370_010665 [Candidatus Sigynarchaeota archaeon]